MFLLFVSLVREIKITRHLADVEVDEDGDTAFIAEVNYADEEAQWLLNGKALFTNEVNTITHEGTVHKLTLKNLAPQDGGTITFQVRKVKESVTLKVKGRDCALWAITQQITHHIIIKRGIHNCSVNDSID